MIKQLIRKPALLIIYILFFGLMAFSILGSSGSRTEINLQNGGSIMQIIIFALFLFVSYMTLSKGLKQGSTFFSMPDVNLIFTAPIRPQTVLVYGIFRQMGMSALTTLFMCFQIPNMINFFGLTATGVFAVLTGWFFLVFSVQASTLCIYSLTAPYPDRRKAGKYILNGLMAVLIVALFVYFLNGNAKIEAVFSFFQLPAVDFFPYVGWLSAYIKYMVSGEYIRALLFLLPAILVPMAGIILVRRTESDYYEDVLQMTETMHANRVSIKEGKTAANQNLGEVKTGKSGLVGKGRGASAFFFRHLTEQRRTGLILFDKMSIIVIAIAVFGGFFMRNNIQSGEVEVFFVEVIGVAVLSYVLYFTSIMGKFTYELSKPYIYLIPAPNVMKLFYSNLASVVKALAEGIVAFSIFAILIGANWWYVPLATLIYAAMSQLYISMTILTQRIMGDAKSKLVTSLVYLLCGGLLLMPGLVIFSASMYFLSQFYPSLIFISYLGYFIYACGVSTLVMFLGQGVLQSGDV
jgi:hypothetical protein